jgi:hypothetical protein
MYKATLKRNRAKNLFALLYPLLNKKIIKLKKKPVIHIYTTKEFNRKLFKNKIFFLPIH